MMMVSQVSRVGALVSVLLQVLGDIKPFPPHASILFYRRDFPSALTPSDTPEWH